MIAALSLVARGILRDELKRADAPGYPDGVDSIQLFLSRLR